MIRLLLFIQVFASCTGGGATARASRIVSQRELIGGPAALGVIGDYKLENDKIRVIIHGPGPNRGSTFFGGSIIDADIQRPGAGPEQGNDLLAEVTPLFLLASFNPDTFEIISDGDDDEIAVVRVEGDSGDFIQAAHLVNEGFLFPTGLRFRVDYKLAPGSSHVEIESTIINDTGTVHPFPFLDPADLAGIGLDIPGIDTLELSVPMGHLLIFSNAARSFASGSAGYDMRFGIEAQYETSMGFPAFPGLVTEFVGAEGPGISYGLHVPSGDNNYVNRYANLYSGQTVKPNSLLVPFMFAGVLGTMHSAPPDILASQQAFTYTTYLTVSDGDMAGISDDFYQLNEIETETVTGRIVDEQTLQPATDTEIIVLDNQGAIVTQVACDEDGDFALDLPPGNYSLAPVTDMRPRIDPIEIDSGAGEFLQIFVPSPAGLTVSVVDEQGRSTPAKVSLVAEHDAANLADDPRDFLYDLRLGEEFRPTDFLTTEAKYIEAVAYADANGQASLAVRPGTYTAVISKGIEYELTEIEVELQSGQHLEIGGQLTRAFSTPGYVSADLHIHARRSSDSSIPLTTRVRSLVGEGVEYGASTDHNMFTDYSAAIADEQLDDWLVSSVGTEVTTFEMGHFNGYPLAYDTSNIRGGDINWAGMTPDEIFDQIRDVAEYGADKVIIQVNHQRDSLLGYFNTFGFNQDTGMPSQASGLAAIFSPYTPEYDLENFSLNFDALELLTGIEMQYLHSYRVPDPIPPPPHPDGITLVPGEILRDIDGNVAFPGVIEDWFALLNRGIRKTGLATSDTHAMADPPAGYGRSYIWVGEDNDEPASFTELDIVSGIQEGRAIASLGAYVDITFEQARIGDTASVGSGILSVTMRAPSWAPIDKLTVWVNGNMEETITLIGDEQTEFDVDIALNLAQDSWVAVEATGSQSMFPVVAPREYPLVAADQLIQALAVGFDIGDALNGYGNVQPSFTFIVTPFAMTNPIFIDHNGDGTFTPPLTFQAGHPHGSHAHSEEDIFKKWHHLRE